MEFLHDWQVSEPLTFQRFGFKIQKRGACEASRVNRFAEYTGTDEATKTVLSTHGRKWADFPHSFWTVPEQEGSLSFEASPTTRLVAMYMDAKCDDA